MDQCNRRMDRRKDGRRDIPIHSDALMYTKTKTDKGMQIATRLILLEFIADRVTDRWSNGHTVGRTSR